MYYKRLLITGFLVTGLIILFSGCKKFPENTLWFKNPKDVFKGGKITSFTMNDIDVRQKYIDLYKNFPYNYYGSSINNVYDTEFTFNAGQNELNSVIGEGTFKFSETQREVEINFKPKNWEFGAESIFLGYLSWKVLKITDSGVLKIETTYNYKKYQIQFN